MNLPVKNSDKKSLREIFRRRRRQLSRCVQLRAEKKVLFQLKRSGILEQTKSVAMYRANDGEVSTDALKKFCLAHNKKVYFPCLQNDKILLFRRIALNSRWFPNRFGIPEPGAAQKSLPINKLDVIVMPLVAFNRGGQRLGMGGGYYDRSLAKLQAGQQRPLLVGFAHSCQYCRALPHDKWDVRLDAIITERRCYFVKR